MFHVFNVTIVQWVVMVTTSGLCSHTQKSWQWWHLCAGCHKKETEPERPLRDTFDLEQVSDDVHACVQVEANGSDIYRHWGDDQRRILSRGAADSKVTACHAWDLWRVLYLPARQYYCSPSTRGQLSLPSLRVGKWVGLSLPASAGNAKAGMVHSVSGWTRGVQVNCEIPWERVPYLSASEVCLRQALYKSTFWLLQSTLWKERHLHSFH